MHGKITEAGREGILGKLMRENEDIDNGGRRVRSSATTMEET